MGGPYPLLGASRGCILAPPDEGLQSSVSRRTMPLGWPPRLMRLMRLGILLELLELLGILLGILPDLLGFTGI